jgi:hypothetical protein
VVIAFTVTVSGGMYTRYLGKSDPQFLTLAESSLTVELFWLPPDGMTPREGKIGDEV